MFKIAISAMLALCLCVGCSSEPATDRAPATESSTQTQDSAIAGSKLPGAAGVGGAMKAADSAEARNARLDSIAAQADP